MQRPQRPIQAAALTESCTPGHHLREGLPPGVGGAAGPARSHLWLRPFSPGTPGVAAPSLVCKATRAQLVWLLRLEPSTVQCLQQPGGRVRFCWHSPRARPGLGAWQWVPHPAPGADYWVCCLHLEGGRVTGSKSPDMRVPAARGSGTPGQGAPHEGQGDHLAEGQLFPRLDVLAWLLGANGLGIPDLRVTCPYGTGLHPLEQFSCRTLRLHVLILSTQIQPQAWLPRRVPFGMLRCKALWASEDECSRGSLWQRSFGCFEGQASEDTDPQKHPQNLRLRCQERKGLKESRGLGMAAGLLLVRADSECLLMEHGESGSGHDAHPAQWESTAGKPWPLPCQGSGDGRSAEP